MKTTRKNIDEVFTPRRAKVNTGMYVTRGNHEKALLRSVKGSMHTFLSGESGNGKSWLYKKVFEDKNIKYVVANCARANQIGSLTEEIYSVCHEKRIAIKTGYTEKKSAGLKAVATAELAHVATYELQQTDKLLEAFKTLNGRIEVNKNIAVIVLDNVETLIRKQELIEELSNIIILLDDERYSGYKVKFLIVGVPNEVIQYFTSTPNASSVGNRIAELPKVYGLTRLQVELLLKKGFVNQLKVSLNDLQLSRLVDHVDSITLGVPQRVHEYCEYLAYLIEDNKWKYVPNLLDSADRQWLTMGLRESYTIVSSHMNSDETSEGRRNQVIYCIGEIRDHSIDTNSVGDVLKRFFPHSAPDNKNGIGQVLAHLCKTESPILKKIEKSSSYVLSDPRLLMCIRVALYIEEGSENVRKKKFKVS